MLPTRFKLKIAVHLFLIKGNQILLLRRFNTGYEDGNYSVPAGHLDGNETATQAMIRETREETTLRLKAQDLEMIHVMHRLSGDDERVDFFFTAKQCQGQCQIGEPDKCDELSWFKLNNLPADTVPYVKKAIENLLNNIYFCEFGW